MNNNKAYLVVLCSKWKNGRKPYKFVFRNISIESNHLKGEYTIPEYLGVWFAGYLLLTKIYYMKEIKE